MTDIQADVSDLEVPTVDGGEPPVVPDVTQSIGTPHDHTDDWDANDIATLRRLHHERKGNDEIARLMGRTKGAIQSKKYRLKKAGRL